MDREELFFRYRANMERLEGEREGYERKMRRLEAERAQARAEFEQDRSRIENIRNIWGDCEDWGRLMTDFEESAEEAYREMERQEESLQEEKRRFQKEMLRCEEWYQEETRKLPEEEE